MRKFFVALVSAYWEFFKAHRLLSFFISVLLMAASLGGLYLLWQQIPTLINLPCLHGGCAG